MLWNARQTNTFSLSGIFFLPEFLDSLTGNPHPPVSYPQQWRIPLSRPQTNARGREGHPLNSRRGGGPTTPQVGHGARPPSDGMAVPSAQCVSDVPRTGTSCWLAKQKCPPFSPPKASAHGEERAPMCNLQSTTHAKGIQSQTRNASALHIWRLSQLDRSVHCARTLLPMRQETPFPMSECRIDLGGW